MKSRINFEQLILKRLPILSWLPKYRIEDGVSDLVAGITVGLTLMPQAIAYAALAGLSPQYGLYSAFAGSLVYIIFGTCPEVNIGPTALISLLTYTYTHDTDPKFAVLLCFLAGCVQLICGILNLGFLVEFISVPVTTGFTSAAALIIACSQFKNLLGLSFKAENFIEIWKQLTEHITESKKWDAILSLGCCLVLLTMRTLKDIKIEPSNGKTLTKNQQITKKFLWFLSVGRNALVVVICALIAYLFERRNRNPFILTGKIDPGLPSINLPPFSASYGNHTYSFTEMCSHFGSGIIIVPLIAILQNIAIAKAFSHGKVVDATQEMFTLGLCNVAGSLFSSIPVSGSFSRSAVNNASGVRTPMGGLYTGALVILTLTFLTPYFFYIPRATLSSVIICAVIFMVEVSALKPMWKTNKIDLVPMLVTFLSCLLTSVEIGILIGIAVDISLVLYFTARPSVSVQNITSPGCPEYIMVTPTAGLLFPAVDHVRAIVTGADQGNPKNSNLPVVVNCQHMHRADYTASKGIQSLISDFIKSDRHLIFYGLQPNVAMTLTADSANQFLQANTDAALIQILKDLKRQDIESQITEYGESVTDDSLHNSTSRQELYKLDTNL